METGDNYRYCEKPPSLVVIASVLLYKLPMLPCDDPIETLNDKKIQTATLLKRKPLRDENIFFSKKRSI